MVELGWIEIAAGFLLFFVTFFIFSVIITPLHELCHIIVAKILKGKVSNIVWLDLKKVLEEIRYPSREVTEGSVHVDLPPEKEKFSGLVDIAGGVGAGLTLMFLGASILVYVIIAAHSFLMMALSLGIICSAFCEFWMGIEEYTRKKKLRKLYKILKKMEDGNKKTGQAY